MHQHPWEIRMEHLGYSHIVLEWRGRPIHFNPFDVVAEDSVLVLLGSWPEQLAGARQMVAQQISCTIVASREILEWLSSFGPVQGETAFAVGDLRIDLEEYTPIARHTPREFARKIGSSARNPFRAARRLQRKKSLPSFVPQIAWIEFPSGVRFAHLHLCLHRNITVDFWEYLKQKAQKSTWIIIGCDYEETESFLKLIEGFSHSQILLSDLVGEYRRQLGLPAHLLTPIADRAISKGIDIQVFASKVGYRFDTVRLHRREEL